MASEITAHIERLVAKWRKLVDLSDRAFCAWPGNPPSSGCALTDSARRCRAIPAGRVCSNHRPARGRPNDTVVAGSFLTEPSTDRAVFRIPLAEARHISAERREELAANYQEHEREARLEGTPQLGTGPVFPLELLPAMIKTVDYDAIPSCARWICGIDFGFQHPFAAALIAWAHDTGRSG